MTLDVVNPFSQTVIKSLPEDGAAEVKAAIDRADKVRTQFAAMTANQRGRILNRAAELIGNYAADIAALIVQESGKPMRYARGEVNRATETFTFAADEARRIHGETVPMDAASGGTGKIGYYVREPIGIIGAITPFNFPINLVAHKVAPAIAAGCPIVLKPSPYTPLTALRLAELLQEAGLPEHVFQVIVGDVEAGKALTTDPRVAMLSFTGSYPVAEKISETAGVRRTVFELGGNAATVIDAGTELTDAVINRLAVGSFAYSGQVCISVQRIYVHESLYDEFKTRFVARTEALKSGDPIEDATEIGPLIDQKAAERIAQWLKDAERDGATVLTGGGHDGVMFQPTVLEGVRDDMKVMCAEVFGPVVNLIPYSDFDTVLDAVNDSEFGLQAGVYTPDLARAMQAIKRLNVGGVIINDVPTFRVDQMPYGGNKKSGVGREGPRFSVEEMTTLKMVVINPTP